MQVVPSVCSAVSIEEYCAARLTEIRNRVRLTVQEKVREKGVGVALRGATLGQQEYIPNFACRYVGLIQKVRRTFQKGGIGVERMSP